MDFFKVVGAEMPESFERQPHEGRFVPVRQVRATDRVHLVAAEIVNTLRVEDADAAQVLRHCVGEIIDNVFVHAQSPIHAVVCAQRFPNAGRTQVGIVDAGVGFFETFKDLYPVRTDRDALVLGLEPYITSKPHSSTIYSSGFDRLGVGLFIVAEVLAAVGGQLMVVSGTSMHRVGVQRRWRRVSPWQGAIVAFEVPDAPTQAYAKATARARARALELARSRE
jgi:anti-sigma regulatory factor (Ser/Thr protein kinase)